MAKIGKAAAKERIDFLKKELERQNYNYYVLNQPAITDFEFDLLMGELQGLEKLYPDTKYVNRLMTHSWGQKVIRFYGPDGNLIEVGTPL